MTVINELLQANQRYAGDFQTADLPLPPAKRLAIVACMDARMTFEAMLGLKTGDAHIIRNAGAIVTEDVLRSLLISLHLAGTQEIMIIGHTDCGMMRLKDQQLASQLKERYQAAADPPMLFHAFTDLETGVREQIRRVKSHPWIPSETPVRGFIFDVRGGHLTEVQA